MNVISRPFLIKLPTYLKQYLYYQGGNYSREETVQGGKLYTVKLGNKERFDKEQIGIKELFMDYQPFYTINLLLDKELWPI